MVCQLRWISLWVGVMASASMAASIWVEGESATEKSVTPHGWYDSVRKEALSGGDWVSHFDENKTGEAAYGFTAPHGGRYVFWVRCNPLHAKLDYRVDDGAWIPVEFKSSDVRGQINIAKDHKPDLRFLAWVRVGVVRLEAGQRKLAFRMRSGPQNHGGIDCFVFTDDGFTPSGTLRPDAVEAAAPDTWFAVAAGEDPFSPESVIDMSALLHTPAGRFGFLHRDGAALRFEQSKTPVQFWGVNAGYGHGHRSRPDQVRHLKYLAKHGVNMIRQHPLQAVLGQMKNGTFDAERLDAWDWWFAQAKQRGLYMTWSVFYPTLIWPEDGYDPALYAELEPKGDARSAYGLVNVEPALQDIQWRYMQAILNHRNAYTGMRYIDDPALAVVEFQNEDCVFFHHPLGQLSDPKQWPKHSERLEKKWRNWLRAKYGSDLAVKRAFGDKWMPGDDFAGGRMRLMAAYHMGGEGPKYEFGGQKTRAGDQIRFLTELQRGFYEQREKQLRDLGFKGVTVTTAWRAGGAAADPANLYADTAADMIDRHNYFGGGDGGHAITTGKVNAESHLDRPGSGLLATGLYQVNDRPFAITEWSSLPPNQAKFEAAPLMAFYGMGLQGWDALYHFANGLPHLGDGWPGLTKYSSDTPHYMGQFPALAFALHHGHVATGPVVAMRRLATDDLFKGVDPLGQDFTGGGHDVKTLDGQQATPPEALAIGRVTIGFDAGEAKSLEASTYWNKDLKTIRSATNQLTWDYGRGLVVLTPEKTQAIIGRAAGIGPVDLPGVKVTIDTPMVSLIFTPLDNQPLKDSKRILITAMARDTQQGAVYSADGTKLEAVGGPPLLMEPVQALIHFKGDKPMAVQALNPYGVPTDRRPAIEAGGAFRIDGRYHAYYYLVTR